MAFTPEELTFLLTSPAAAAAIATAERLVLTRASMIGDISAVRKELAGAASSQSTNDCARAVVELVRARRAAASKMPAEWLVDTDAAQQATPRVVAVARSEVIAAYVRAVGAEGVEVRALDVTCSVGTELAALQAAGIAVAGADLDPVRVRMARANLPGVPIVCADALQTAWSPEVLRRAVVVADPARRNSSGRIARLADVVPAVPDLVDTYLRDGGRVGATQLAVKCAPGVDFAELGDWVGLIDVVSVDREVKEACAYSRGIATAVLGAVEEGDCPASPVRRAVVIRTGVDAPGGVQRTVWDSTMPAELDDEAAAGQPGRFIIDPDGAIIRAGLVRHYAAAQGLWQLDPRIAYLTGDTVPPGERGFEILEQVGLKQIKAAVKRYGATAVEILVRGVDIDPDALRSSLKLKTKGKKRALALTLVVTRIGSAGVVFICRAQAASK